MNLPPNFNLPFGCQNGDLPGNQPAQAVQPYDFVRECPACGRMVDETAPKCPECGYEFEE